jgi:hypothetical protein
MRTVADVIKALEGFPPTAPVQIGWLRPDNGLVVHEIDAIEAREDGVVLLVAGHTPDTAFEARAVEADQTGEVIAAPPPPAVPGGLEGEGEEPEPPKI